MNQNYDSQNQLQTDKKQENTKEKIMLLDHVSEIDAFDSIS